MIRDISCQSTEELRILLPEFATEVVLAFIGFIYTGEVLLPLGLRSEFLSLCHHMHVNLPEHETNTVTVSEDCFEENHLQDVDVNSESPDVDEEVVVEGDDIETMDYSELDQGYQKASESLHDNDDNGQNSNFLMTTSRGSTFRMNLNRAISAVKSGGMLLRHPLMQLHNSIYFNSLELNTMQSARRFGIPKTTLYRWTSKIKNEGEGECQFENQKQNVNQ